MEVDIQHDHEVVEATLKLPPMTVWSGTNRRSMILPSIEQVLLQNHIHYQRRLRVLRHHPYARPLRVQRFVALFWLPPLISPQCLEDENESGAVVFNMASCQLAEILTYLPLYQS